MSQPHVGRACRDENDACPPPSLGLKPSPGVTGSTGSAPAAPPKGVALTLPRCARKLAPLTTATPVVVGRRPGSGSDSAINLVSNAAPTREVIQGL